MNAKRRRHDAALIMYLAWLGMSGTSSGAEPAPYRIERTALLPEAIASFGAAVAGDFLYVTGGHTGRPHQHSRDNLSDGFHRLNLKQDNAAWESLPGGKALQSVSLVAHGGRLYRIGGMSAVNERGDIEDLHSVADVDRFDPAAREWTPLPALPEPRSSHDAVVLGDRIFVAGGWTLNGDSDNGQWLDTAHVLDLSADSPEWKPIAPPPFRRRAVALAAAGGRVFVIGGIGTDGKTSRKVDIYDPTANVWTEGPELPDSGFGSSAFGIGGAVYELGLDGRLCRLTRDAEAWEPIESVCFPRFFHRLVPASSDTLLVVGGAARGGHLRQIEFLSLKHCRNATPRVWRWTLPVPGQAKNRQAVFLHENALYAFGGNNSLEQHDFEPENFLCEGFRIHPGSLMVKPVADFPTKRQSMRTLLADEGGSRGLAIGGFGHDGEVARSHADVWEYDFKADEWERIEAALPAPRTQFGPALRDGIVWIFGGLDYDPRRPREDRFRHVTDVLKWDTRESDGTFISAGIELRRPRRAFGSALLDDRFYLISGMREGFQVIPECDVFDFKTMSWESMPASSKPRISPEVVALNGRLFMAGGSSPDASGEIVPNTGIEVYDPRTQQWSTLLKEMPISPKHIQMFAFGRHLLIYSAQQEKNAVELIVIDPRMGEDESEKAITRRPAR